MYVRHKKIHQEFYVKSLSDAVFKSQVIGFRIRSEKNDALLFKHEMRKRLKLPRIIKKQEYIFSRRDRTDLFSENDSHFTLIRK